jgi:hypothetical protein
VANPPLAYKRDLRLGVVFWFFLGHSGHVLRRSPRVKSPPNIENRQYYHLRPHSRKQPWLVFFTLLTLFFTLKPSSSSSATINGGRRYLSPNITPVATSPPNIQYRHSLCHQLTHHIDTSTVLTASSITTTTTNDKRQLGARNAYAFRAMGMSFSLFIIITLLTIFFLLIDCHHQHISTQLRQRRARDATTGLETCRTRLKPW